MKLRIKKELVYIGRLFAAECTDDAGRRYYATIIYDLDENQETRFLISRVKHHYDVHNMSWRSAFCEHSMYLYIGSFTYCESKTCDHFDCLRIDATLIETSDPDWLPTVGDMLLKEDNDRILFGKPAQPS